MTIIEYTCVDKLLSIVYHPSNKVLPKIDCMHLKIRSTYDEKGHYTKPHGV